MLGLGMVMMCSCGGRGAFGAGGVVVAAIVGAFLEVLVVSGAGGLLVPVGGGLGVGVVEFVEFCEAFKALASEVAPVVVVPVVVPVLADGLLVFLVATGLGAVVLQSAGGLVCVFGAPPTRAVGSVVGVELDELAVTRGGGVTVAVVYAAVRGIAVLALRVFLGVEGV